MSEVKSPSRRRFIRAIGTAGAVASFEPSIPAEAAYNRSWRQHHRDDESMKHRIDAARFQHTSQSPPLPNNGDEDRYSRRIGSFSKSLPHNEFGEVEVDAYDALLLALRSGRQGDYDAIPAGGYGKLVNPQAAYAYSYTGVDSHKIYMPPVHALNSPCQSAEAAEVYWMAVTRDVRFSRYHRSRIIAKAAADMSRYSDFRGPKKNLIVTPHTLFRGLTPGDLVGPYISQFLFLDIPYGNQILTQRALPPHPRQDYMWDIARWCSIQRGQFTKSSVSLRPTQRYIMTGRDLAEYVHKDFSYQAYLNAALICLSYEGALDPQPYSVAERESGLITFGPACVLDLVAKVAVAALRVAWFHKWLVHRKLRPEAFGGRVHFHLTEQTYYPLDSEFLSSGVLDIVWSRAGTYLLPQAYPEGSPVHPSYPAGHAAVAGACITVLKALFDEEFIIPDPVIPNRHGDHLIRFRAPLTLGGELNKLGSNIALGRNIAGVHWRADGDNGLVAGEEVAISILQDHLRSIPERGIGLRLTRFNGMPILIKEDRVLRQ